MVGVANSVDSVNNKIIGIRNRVSNTMGFSRQAYWSGLPFTPPGDLPDPGIELGSPVSPAWAGRFFATRNSVLA